MSPLLPYRPPFRWHAIAGFLGQRAIDGIESFDGTRFMRQGAIIEPGEGDALRMTALHDVDALIVRARRTFDLDADPNVIDAHLRRDKRLRPLLARRPGPRVPGAWEPIEVAVRAI